MNLPNLNQVSWLIGIDIGGSLIKASLSTKSVRDSSDISRVQFVHVNLTERESLFKAISECRLVHRVCLTGGGALKFKEELVERWKRHELVFLDEMSSLARGACMLRQSTQPFLLVNVGSGVSILKIEDKSTFSRVSGSCIGGGTYMGLIRMLLRRPLSFEEALAISKSGRSAACDMLVRDIYGGAVPSQSELIGDLVASSMGKYTSSSTNDEDAAAGILQMIVISIGHVTVLNSRLFPECDLIFCGGFFSSASDDLLTHQFALLTTALSYWNANGSVLAHSAYIGSVGALSTL